MSNLFLKHGVREKKKKRKNPYFAIDWESIRDSANNNDDDRYTQRHIHTYVPQRSTVISIRLL